MIMGIRKKTYYVCDNTNCNKDSEDSALFILDVPMQLGNAKDKKVLCKDCKAEYDEYMARYFGEGEEEEVQEDEYDPTTDRAFSKYTPEQALHHRAAKLWAVSPKSTLKGNERPKGLKGPAAQKVLEAYDAYLEDQRRKVAEAQAAHAGPEAEAYRNGTAAKQ